MKRKKILLIYPKIKTVVIQSPLSILTLASVLKKKGFDVEIIDTRITKNYMDIIKKAVKQKDILSVGISMMTGTQIMEAIKIAKLIKSVSKIPVVFGGVHPTVLPEQTLKNRYIDFVVIGMGEIPFLSLNNLLTKEIKNYSKIDGLGYKKNGKIFINPIKHNKINLDDFPPPAWELVNVEDYLEKNLLGKYALTLITSRGCPHRCSFCYSQGFFNRLWHNRSAKNVLKEVDWLLKKYPMIDSIFFNDDNFVVDKKRMIKICKGLNKRNIKYFICSRAEYVDEKLIKFLKENNCDNISVGAESGSQRLLDRLNKDIKVKDLIRVAELCNKYKLKSLFSFMFGHPTETEKDLNKTLDLINELIKINPLSDFTSLKIMTPYPGTNFFKEAIKYGFQPPKTLKDWGSHEWTECNLPWIKNKRMYETISFVVMLNFYSHRLKTGGKLISNLLIDALHHIASLRWEKRFWKFGIEVPLIKLYLRLFV